MSLLINCVIPITGMCNLHIKETEIHCISKTKQGNQKLKDNLLCYIKCSFK